MTGSRTKMIDIWWQAQRHNVTKCQKMLGLLVHYLANQMMLTMTLMMTFHDCTRIMSWSEL